MAKKVQRWVIPTLGISFVIPGVIFVVFLYAEATKPDPAKDLSAAIADALLADSDVDTGESGLSRAQPAWRVHYPKTTPMRIGEVTLEASVAASWPERIKGLSGTPFLPEAVAKFFVFDTAGFHSIWMKDMNYAIDIIWLDDKGKIVYLVENATPDSYPETFTPAVPARFVVEVVSGFIAKYGIDTATMVELPEY